VLDSADCRDPLIESVRDLLVSFGYRVLVDHRGTHTVMAHSRIQVRQAHPCLRRQGISGVPKIMKVQARNAERSDGACSGEVCS